LGLLRITLRKLSAPALLLNTSAEASGVCFCPYKRHRFAHQGGSALGNAVLEIPGSRFCPSSDPDSITLGVAL
jgi:hypothetical protein